VLRYSTQLNVFAQRSSVVELVNHSVLAFGLRLIEKYLSQPQSQAVGMPHNSQPRPLQKSLLRGR
jgi:hypothetical protein